MAAPWNAAIAFDNLADRGIITASSSAILTPPSILQNPHIARKWRGASGESEYLTADLLADVVLDTVAVIGLSLTDQKPRRTDLCRSRRRLSHRDADLPGDLGIAALRRRRADRPGQRHA
jgi:hypothetical protein